MLQVYLKELLELTRDRKTLIFTILLPTLIMPVIIFGFLSLSGKIAKKSTNESLEYAVIGGRNYPELAKELAKNPRLKLMKLSPDQNVKEMIQKGNIRFAVRIPADTGKRLRQGLGANITMLYDGSGTTSIVLYNRVEASLKNLKTIETKKRYAELGLSVRQGQAVNKPIIITQKSIASERETFGENLGGMLPYLLVLICFSGAMYPALDLGVGEKERGTLETLLLTPVPRFKLVFAKFLVIFTTSFVSVLLSLISFVLMAGFFGGAIVSDFLALAMDSGPGDVGSANIMVNPLETISLFDVFLIFLMLTPVAAIFASVLLSLSIYARTFKEAQNYMSPILILVLLPLMLALLPGVKLDWVWAAVPITNIALAIKEILKGNIDLRMLVVIFGSTSLIAGVFLAYCNWWFQREEVLFRS